MKGSLLGAALLSVLTGPASAQEAGRFDAAIAALQPQRPGVVDAYVVTVALDADPVFAREAGEAARVLARRYGAAGRTVALADGGAASPDDLGRAVARVGVLADHDEDVLVLFATTHGHPQAGLVWREAGGVRGAVPPAALAGMLGGAGLSNRLVILSACYAGVFVPALRGERSVVVTAASAERSSFGCEAENDWTFFGDALVNRALRKPQPLSDAVAEARGLIGAWEGRAKLAPSQPQFSMGSRAGRWLRSLEARMPKEGSAPVGRSPVASR